MPRNGGRHVRRGIRDGGVALEVLRFVPLHLLIIVAAVRRRGRLTGELQLGVLGGRRRRLRRSSSGVGGSRYIIGLNLKRTKCVLLY